MNATALLQQDHDRVKQLFRDYEAASSSPSVRKELVHAIKTAIHAHTHVEEEVFYPAVIRVRAKDAKEAVRAALEEHHLADGLVAELDALYPEDDIYDRKIEALRASVFRHIAQEEQRMFAQARMHLTDERLEALGQQMTAAARR